MNEFNYTSWMQQNRVGPYGKMNLKESGTGDAPFDFNKAAIESATGDKISHTEEDDYGRPIYWSTKNPNVTYYINDDDQIIKYDGETGERFPIGDLKNYDDPDFDIEPDTDADYEEPRDDFDMAGDYNDGEFWEGKEGNIDEAGNVKGIRIEIPGNSSAADFGKAAAREVVESFGPRDFRVFLQAFTEEITKLTSRLEEGEGTESVSISISENTDYKELAKAVAKVLIEDYGQHNYKPFMQALIAELK